MLLTIRNTRAPVDDLGWLLHKHPGKAQSFDVGFGRVHVFYPELTDAACTAALLLDVDPVRLVRGGGAAEGLLAQYVNDRPYAASSLMSVAIAQVLRSALTGQSKERAELVQRPLELTATLPVLPCRGGEPLLRALFEPLGYAVRARAVALGEDEHLRDGGPYLAVELARTAPLRELLSHLYVLIPVLDDDKHYYIGDEEVDKLLRFGEGWLSGHPERELIARRYLKHRGSLTRQALARLAEGEADAAADDEAMVARDRAEDSLERPLSLDEERLRAVEQALVESGAARVLDLGCGSGKLIARTYRHPRARGRRHGRRQRLGQDDLRAPALQADRGAVVRLLPRPRVRR